VAGNSDQSECRISTVPEAVKRLFVSKFKPVVSDEYKINFSTGSSHPRGFSEQQSIFGGAFIIRSDPAF